MGWPIANSMRSARVQTGFSPMFILSPLATDIRDHNILTAENFQEQPALREDLSTYDAIFIRKDPPFDDHYISLTLLLEPLEGKVQFVNSPKGVRAISEKLSALHFMEDIPHTLATYHRGDLRAFAAEHGKVVLKPSYFGSGTGVVVTHKDDPDFEKAIDNILNLPPHGPVIAQGFLEEVAKGDTRMMVINGEAVGALGRQAGEGDFRTNIAAGGHEVAVEATPRQLEISRRVGDYLKTNKIIFAGLDFIGDHLIEINVTSPTLIQQLRTLGGPDISVLIWDYLEAHK